MIARPLKIFHDTRDAIWTWSSQVVVGFVRVAKRLEEISIRKILFTSCAPRTGSAKKNHIVMMGETIRALARGSQDPFPHTTSAGDSVAQNRNYTSVPLYFGAPALSCDPASTI